MSFLLDEDARLCAIGCVRPGRILKFAKLDSKNMMRIENPTVIATHDFIWHKKDGTTAPVQVMIGAPYRQNSDWACPCAIFGFEGRYPDIVGISSIQALSLAISLVSKQLKWMVENGEVLDLSEDGKHIDLELVTSLFGGR